MPDAPFQLTIVSPTGTVFEGLATAVNVPGVEGEMVVLAAHMPLVTALEEGEVRVRTAHGEISIAVSGGFLRVDENGVRILSDFAAEAQNIEVARVQAAKDRAEELLKARREKKEIALIERDLQRAILQLKVAEKIRRRRSAPGAAT